VNGEFLKLKGKIDIVKIINNEENSLLNKILEKYNYAK
jgi:hypothetical protein